MYGLDIHKMSENWLKKCGIFLWNLFPYCMKKLTKPFQKLFSKDTLERKISKNIKFDKTKATYKKGKKDVLLHSRAFLSRTERQKVDIYIKEKLTF